MKTSKTLSALVAAASLLVAGGWAHAAPPAQVANPSAVPAQAPALAPAAYPQPTISLEQAIAIAEKHIPGGKVKDVEMDYEWGRMVYEVEVVAPGWREYDVMIDATTGKILFSRLDWFD